MLFKPWLSCVNGSALWTWKTASLFGNDIWIVGCNCLPNLSAYSLAVIQPWRVLQVGPADYCTTILLPKPSQNLPVFHSWNQAFRIVGFLRCAPNVINLSSWFSNSMKGDLSDHIMRAFPVVWCPGFMVVTPSFTHLSVTFSVTRG
jgi:hypothetical protein